MTYHNKIRSILGVDVRARYSETDSGNYEPFKNPLIHKQINGSEIVPLNITKLWRN
ncbi:hypothetical protein [Bacillus sp. 1NLA3E]|uniref:hypothetical protein n=1 Tax=Bacillus sp. 1NLA3E TaxID=666686 RepID=UPI000247E664|nr:hypothetical protein [Bacillus sp. 1NLA3E]